MASRMLMETQSKTTYKRIAIVLTAMVGFILAGNAALTAAIVQLSQNVKVASDGKLQTASGDAMTVQSMPNVQTTVHSSRRRRLRMLDGRRRLEVAQVSEEMCNAAHTMATKSSMYEGFVKIDSDDGGETRFAHGDVVGQSSKSTYTLTGTDKGLGLTDTVDVTLSSGQPCSVSLPASRLRQLRALNEEEVGAYRRFRRRHRRLDQSAVQSLLMTGNVTVNMAPPCELYHCFDGDADCEYPSQDPEIDCMEWSEGSANGGRRCLDPMCALVHVDHKKNERRLAHGWYAGDGTARDSDDACGYGEKYYDFCWRDDADPNHADCRCQGDSCFPSASMVRLADGTAARIDSLHHGDSILAAAEDGSLYMDTVSVFSLANSAVSAPMISLRIDGGRRLRFTASHHIPVGPACCSNLAQAKDVRRGDTVWVAAPGASAAEPRRVAHVAAELGKGLHNPLLTHGGFPVVDDVVTSFNSIGMVRLDRTLVPPLTAACAATGGGDAMRRIISSVDCLFAANCKDQRFVDGLVLQARAQHAADVAWPLASALVLAVATAGAAGASFLALRMNKSKSQCS